jgi:hypothetical protein
LTAARGFVETGLVPVSEMIIVVTSRDLLLQGQKNETPTRGVSTEGRKARKMKNKKESKFYEIIVSYGLIVTLILILFLMIVRNLKISINPNILNVLSIISSVFFIFTMFTILYLKRNQQYFNNKIVWLSAVLAITGFGVFGLIIKILHILHFKIPYMTFLIVWVFLICAFILLVIGLVFIIKNEKTRIKK